MGSRRREELKRRPAVTRDVTLARLPHADDYELFPASRGAVASQLL